MRSSSVGRTNGSRRSRAVRMSNGETRSDFPQITFYYRNEVGGETPFSVIFEGIVAYSDKDYDYALSEKDEIVMEADLTEAQWGLAEIRADIEGRKEAGTLTEEQELDIVLDSLHVINRIHPDLDDLHRAQRLFWDAEALPLTERIGKLWEALDLFLR